MAKYVLIEVVDREITHFIFEDYAIARDTMLGILSVVMREECGEGDPMYESFILHKDDDKYDGDEDYGFCQTSAWYNGHNEWDLKIIKV